jgi:hypothetical protein
MEHLGGIVMLLQLNHLIIRRKARVLGVAAECTICDLTGKTLGYVLPERKAKRDWVIVRLLGLGRFLPRRLDDPTGKTILRMAISYTSLRTKMRVFHGDGTLVGIIRQRELLRKWHFDLASRSESFGVIVAEDDRAWRFRVLDPHGEEIGRITRRLQGALRELWTTGSDYDLQLRPEASSSLRLLALAVAVSVDIAFTDKDILGNP